MNLNTLCVSLTHRNTHSQVQEQNTVLLQVTNTLILLLVL